MTLTPHLLRPLCGSPPKYHCVKVPWRYITICGYNDHFVKTLTKMSVTCRWPLTLLLIRSYMWLYPSIILSKSHGNAPKCVDTVTIFDDFSKLYQNTTCYLHSYILHINTLSTRSFLSVFKPAVWNYPTTANNSEIYILFPKPFNVIPCACKSY